MIELLCKNVGCYKVLTVNARLELDNAIFLQFLRSRLIGQQLSKPLEISNPSRN